jgi:glycosyltransferase involved in cell wall biosynthesis
MEAATDRAPIRVCFVVGYFFPLQSGAERQALEQAAELVHQGHTVHVLTRWVPGLKIDDVVHGVQIHRWVKLTRWGPFFGLSFLWGFRRALERLRPCYDVIHTHQALWEAAATGLFQSRHPEVPTIVQPASSGYFGEAQELRRTHGSHWLLRRILRNTRFATISAEIAREWRALGVPEGRIFATASGVDTRRFRRGPCVLDDALPPHPRVVFTGRLHAQKNLNLLLEAWSGVRLRVPAHLLLIGEGPERDALEAQIQMRGLADSIHLLGAVADPAEYLRGADAFVLPSRAEGMSNSLLEAMATALPCVVSDIGGNRDLVQPGRTGFLLPPDEPTTWTETIVRILNDRGEAARLGQEAREFVEGGYAISRVVEHNLGLYRELLGHPRA